MGIDIPGRYYRTHRINIPLVTGALQHPAEYQIAILHPVMGWLPKPLQCRLFVSRSRYLLRREKIASAETAKLNNELIG